MINRLLSIKFLLPVLMLSAVMIFSSCQKYPDGPALSFKSRKARVVNTWQADRIFRNQIDRTLEFSLYAMDFTDAGRLTWTVVPNDSSSVDVVLANWELASKDTQIRLDIDGAPQNSKLLYMDILKLKSKEMRLQYTLDGHKWDIWLIPL